MADGKEIPINIKTATDNSGLEKAKQGTDQLDQSMVRINDTTKKNSDEVARNRKEFDEWQESLNRARKERGPDSYALAFDPAKIEKVTEKIDATTKSSIKLGNAQDDAARGSKAMSFAMQNMGYQVADVAIQLEMGTSALRVFTQQVPQMLGAFGGPAALAGAAVATIGVGINYVIDQMDRAEESAKAALEKRKQLLKDAEQAAAESARQAKIRDEELKSDEIELAIRRQNAALEEGLALLNDQITAARKKRLEQEEILSAEDELKLAEIEFKKTSGSISDEDAERQRMQIVSGAKKRADDYRKDEARLKAFEAERQAKLKEDNAKALEVENQSAAKQAEDAKIAEAVAKKRVEIEQKRKAWRDAEWAAINAEASRWTTAEQKVAINKAAKEAKDDYFATDFFKLGINENKETPASLARDVEVAQQIAREKSETAEEAKKSAEEARKQADRAARDAEAKRSQGIETIAMVDQKAELEAKAREIRVATERAAAQNKANEAAKKQTEKFSRDAERKRDSQTKDAASIGRSAVGLLPKGVTDRFRRDVVTAAEALQDGAQKDEIKTLVDLMNQLAKAVQVKGTKTSMDIVHIKERIKQLEKQK